MTTTSLVRLRCYWLLMGIEQSLARILVDSSDVNDPDFLADEQQTRGLKRLQDDLQDEGWSLDDATNEILLEYLDLGDLLQLLNRHSGRNERNIHLTGELTREIARIEVRDLANARFARNRRLPGGGHISAERRNAADPGDDDSGRRAGGGPHIDQLSRRSFR